MLREPVAGSRHWEGSLARFADGLVTLNPTAGDPVEFRLEAVERANLKFDW